MPAWPDWTITLRRQDTGIIEIGELPASIAGVGFVGIAGGTAYVDPAYPDRLPFFEIADAALAYDALADLLGSGLADACLTLQAAEDGTGPSDAESVVAATPLLDALVDLATLRWLDLRAPWPLDERVLELEIAVLEGRLDCCLDAEVDPIARCEGISGTILAALGVSAELPSKVRELTLEAAGLLLDNLPTNDRRWPVLDAALARADEPDAERHTQLPDATIGSDLEPIIGMCSPELALAAGDRGQLWANSEGVDWRFVRRGLVARDEGALTWGLDLSTDDPTLSVSVGMAGVQTSCLPVPSESSVSSAPSAPTAPAGHDAANPVLPELDCVAYLGSAPIILALGRLRLDADRGTWSARLPLGRDVDGIRALLVQTELTVVVHEAGRVPGPLSAPDRAAAAARRWGARGLGAARLCSTATAGTDGRSDGRSNGRLDGSSELRDAARAALTTARQIWRMLPGPDAAHCAQRCSELVEALTAGTFAPRQSVTEALLVGGA